jgi:hypothetical protein
MSPSALKTSAVQLVDQRQSGVWIAACDSCTENSRNFPGPGLPILVEVGTGSQSLTLCFSFQIEVLEAEVSALKTLVITSTPSMPNRHLHPQINTKPNKSNEKFVKSHKRSTSHHDFKKEIETLQVITIDPDIDPHQQKNEESREVSVEASVGDKKPSWSSGQNSCPQEVLHLGSVLGASVALEE